MFRAFNLSSKYGRSKAEKILLTYQTFAISVKVPTPYTTQPPCHNCVAILGGYTLYGHITDSQGSFIVARAFYAHNLCPRQDKLCMKIYANSRYKDKSAQTVVCQSKRSS